MKPITLIINTPTLNPYSKSQWNADVYCSVCGRGIANRENAQVVVCDPADENGAVTFQPIPMNQMGRDSAEWGSFIGNQCAKRLPKTHKISQQRVMTALWVKNGCP